MIRNLGGPAIPLHFPHLGLIAPNRESHTLFVCRITFGYAKCLRHKTGRYRQEEVAFRSGCEHLEKEIKVADAPRIFLEITSLQLIQCQSVFNWLIMRRLQRQQKTLSYLGSLAQFNHTAPRAGGGTVPDQAIATVGAIVPTSPRFE